ncbi:MAG: hypothetical protein CFE25_13925 [Chitinophagaceae bacterium BSSC1]|nr:MAG: hypothetical protein CFE25_13925 [Chitinophagaceae bacterium BSSC1]
MRAEMKDQLNKQMIDWKQGKETEFKQKEQQFQQLLKQKEEEANKRHELDKKQLQTELQQSIQKKVSEDFENKLRLLEENAAESAEKLKMARQKELEFLQKEQALLNKEAEMQVQMQRQLMQEREKLKEQLVKEETEKSSIKDQEHLLRVKELEKQLEDQKKLAEEMRRRSELGSQQLQGEVQELMLEELLAKTFPFDRIDEVGKGVRGADCIQVVRNQLGAETGKIIYESKRTKDFSNDWIEKLKADMRGLGADVAVIVTQALPKDMDRFGEKDGVYICTFAEVKSVALLLRNAILKVWDAKKSQENKGDKMVMLYDYLTGTEFSLQWKAISEAFNQMKQSIQVERNAMEKLWKTREKQLEKVLLNAAHIQGSIEGIAGADAVNLNLTDQDPLLLD